jgi:hypothetical protein
MYCLLASVLTSSGAWRDSCRNLSLYSLTDKGALLQCQEFFLPLYHQTFWNVVLAEVVSELLPGDSFGVSMSGEVGLPPRLSCSP